MAKDEPKMVGELRELIRKSGITPYRFEMDTGVLRGSTLRFLAGEHVLSFTNAAKIAEHLGHELRKVRRTRRR